MSTSSQHAGEAAPGARSRIRAVALAGVALMLAGALYLYAVRGEAMLLDLAGMARGLLCF